MQEELKRIVGTKDPEFWPDNTGPYFNLPNGALSCNGDEILTTLSVMNDIDNDAFDVEKLVSAVAHKFGSPGGQLVFA